jgi:hypothetical protein
MSRFASTLLGVGVIAVVAAAALFGWWATDLRWRPHTLDRNAAQIQATLDQAGWVSPGLSKTRVLWMISYRSCPDCIRFEDEEFQRFHASGVDTRVIMAPRPRGTTPAERATIAALWLGRDWKLYKAWTDVPIAAWTAEGLPSADSDPARVAALQKSQAFIRAMTPLMADNGVALHYPTLIWRDADGRLRGCACEKRETYRFVRRELGVRS